MTTTTEMIAIAVKHLENKYDARKALPIDARNLVMCAYNVLMDMQGDGFDVEDAHEAITEAVEAITEYVNQDETPESVRDSIGAICRPVHELMHHLNYVQAYGE